MTKIEQDERATYRDIWSSVDAYADHAPGEHWAPLFLAMVDRTSGTLLDAGCGTGKGGVALANAGFDVTLADLTPDGLTPAARSLPFFSVCLWHDLYDLARQQAWPGRSRFDYVYCCDVLEHIPPQFTMLVVDQLLRVTRHGLFLSVALTPDHFGAWIGKPLHQTVQAFTWWRDSLSELGTMLEARDCQKTGLYWMRPTSR
jgi:2-polyprenyl-3-methyl-5-hydroxy-6-metoxy-1,4-benzoquinol methylase